MLYNTHRPVTASQLVGQPSLSAYLKSLDPAAPPGCVLLIGGSGVGKTTAARVLARKLHCAFLTPDGDVCGRCATCLGVSKGHQMDVSEYDAASNSGADDVRRLVAQVVMSTMTGKRRVVILDEVQAFSKQAWQVLLKPLEENNTTTFVLCSTEPDKVPNTIQTRAVKFQLTEPGRDDVTELLTRVAKAEGKALSEEAARMVAFNAGASYREVLSLLEKLLPYAEGGAITAASVQSAGVLSPAEVDLYRELPRLLSSKNAVKLFELVRGLPSAEEPQRAFLTYFYNLLRKRALTSAADMRSLNPVLRDVSRVLGDFTIRPNKYTIEHLLWTYLGAA